MQSAQRAEGSGFSLVHMEDIESAPEGARKFYRELAYDAGAWAIVFMIHSSEKRSVSALRDEFYPAVDLLGWRAALCQFTNMASVQDFYQAFGEFMTWGLQDQMVLLEGLVE